MSLWDVPELRRETPTTDRCDLHAGRGGRERDGAGLVAVPKAACAALSAVYTAQPDTNSRKAALCLQRLQYAKPLYSVVRASWIS